ncbi:anti-sigma regulatory factor (Ser/Thr protein kinase) [Streptomonospora nanhaiensis]|uniref:Anti-sigma regulatory factor (Ser/Thr protein kinase) n=1 Tax=Streptomonospora nanhaiensis TaxID=1323731 RepID=A0A853BU54_9ACTN|nr:anti-sigma regulatory factor (Ser/Thr protein kinase) [Streptomonospora nanhaiensis]
MRADLELAVSEFFSNCVRHSRGGRVVVGVQCAPGTVRLWVTDPGSDAPAAAPAARLPHPLALDGRGLCLVGAVCSRWGLDIGTTLTRAWCEVPAAPGPEGRLR